MAPVANAPVNLATLPGIVEYSFTGTDGRIAKRRANTFEKMTTACSAPYRIGDEGPQVSSQAKGTATKGIIHFSRVRADSCA